jgi:hypothetical protein
LLKRFLRYTIRPVRPVEKWLVCKRKGPICKDLTVEINFVRLFSSCGSIQRSYGLYKGIIENVKWNCCI